MTKNNTSFQFKYAQISETARKFIENGLPDKMTLKEVSDLFQINPETLRRWSNRGQIESVRIKKGKRNDRRFTKHEVLRILSKGLRNNE